MNSQEQLRGNTHDLWLAVFGGPLAGDAPPTVLLDRLVGGLPLPTYDVLRHCRTLPPLEDR